MNAQASGLVVDVVIDNYNYGDFLAEAIASVRAQTHPAVNLIVVDDGSTDGSRELLQELAGDATVVLKENGGQASALNAGLQRSQGEVVIFLDADDVLHPEAAARVAAAFADESVAKVQFRMDMIDSGGRSLGTIKPPTHVPLPNGDVRERELSSPFDLPWLAMSGNSFRASALRRIAPIPEPNFRICADWYLVHLTALLGDVVSLEQVGASYRLHGGNNYELQAPRFELDHVRRTIGLAASTLSELSRLADELGLDRPRPILSIWDLANRLASLRIDPAHHPLPDDSVAGILRDAVRAARRRKDVSPPLRLMFVAWFATTAIAPRRFVPWLVETFLFAERRQSLNRLLERLHRRPPSAAPAVEG